MSKSPNLQYAGTETPPIQNTDEDFQMEPNQTIYSQQLEECLLDLNEGILV